MIASWQIMLVLRMPIAFKFSAVLGPKAPDGHPCSPPEMGRISSFGRLCEAAKTIQSAVEVMASSVTSVLHSLQRLAALFFALALSITRTDRCAKLSLHGGSGMAVTSRTLSCSFVCIHALGLVHSATRHKITHTTQGCYISFRVVIDVSLSVLLRLLFRVCPLTRGHILQNPAAECGAGTPQHRFLLGVSFCSRSLFWFGTSALSQIKEYTHMDMDVSRGHSSHYRTAFRL